jgi:site-specific DNA recombinase
MDNIRAAIYIRVSTQEQADEGYSIPMQTERLKKYSEAKGWIVANTYTDPGYSGGNLERPALSKMTSDIKSGNIDLVLVYKLDRLSRSQKDTLYLIEDVFLKNNVDFVSMNENFDTSSPFGRAMIGILSVFAQLEREQIKERMAMGHIGRAKDGYWHGGSGAPIGYDFVDGDLIVNEYEAMQVREIFDLFLHGNTIHGITDIMKSKYSNRYSGWNNHGTVGKILKNTVYIGKIKYKEQEYQGQHEPIISDDIFISTQKRYRELERGLTDSQKSPYKGKHLLSGMIFCGNCGARYFTKCVISKKSGTYFYYICYSRDGNREMKKIDFCKNPNYREDVLDEMIKEQILILSHNPDIIQQMKEQGQSKTSDDKAIIINHRISEIGKQVNKLMDLYQIGTIPLSDISSRIEPLQKERGQLESELNELANNNTPNLSIEDGKKIVRTAEYIFENGTVDEKRNLVNTLISRIVIFSNEIKIYWKFINYNYE